MLITVSTGDVNPKYSKIDLTEALTPFSLELNDKCPHKGEKRVEWQYLLKKNTGPMDNSSFSILANFTSSTCFVVNGPPYLTLQGPVLRVLHIFTALVLNWHLVQVGIFGHSVD